MSNLNIWMCLAGLGLFLFGMSQIETSIKELTGQRFRRFLRKTTSRPITSIAAGTFATAILQSSSVVGLIVMAFVGAGALQLSNAVGVILGANLGTTFTGWIVATFGFKLKLGAFALPIIATGSLAHLLFKPQHKASQYGQLIFGFGLLLFGLDFMKEGVEQFSQHLDLSQYEGYPLIIFALVGLIFTAIVQSSSATMTLTLAALNANVISLDIAAAIVVGANLGTTGTLLIGGITGVPAKRQVSVAHFLFNLVTSALAFTLLYPLLYIINHVFYIEDVLYALVVFHSSFNILGILIFLPFIKVFTTFLQQHFSKDTSDISQYIHNVPPAVPEAAVTALEKETRNLINKVVLLNLHAFKINPESLFHSEDNGFARLPYADAYESIKRLEGKALSYISKVQQFALSPEETAALQHLRDSISNSLYACKNIKDVRVDLVEFRHADNDTLQNHVNKLTEQIRYLYKQVHFLIQPHEAGLLQDEIASMREKFMLDINDLNNAIASPATLENIDSLSLSTLLNVSRATTASSIKLIEAVETLVSCQQLGEEPPASTPVAI